MSHNFNDVFEVADQIAVLYLGRLVASIPAADLDRQMVVDLVTSGATSRARPRCHQAERSLTMTQETEPIPPLEQGGEPPVARGAEWLRRLPQAPTLWSRSGRTPAPTGKGCSPGTAASCPSSVGLVLISIVFQTGNSHFLTAENLVNWLQQASLYMVMAMGIVFVLLLGEIDLSVGYVGLLGGAIAAEMLSGTHPWPLAIVIVVSLGACAAIGFVQGLLITRLGLPSFVVTLAGLLGWEGVLLLVLGNGGTVPINDNIFDDFATGHTNSLLAGWLIIGALVVIYAVVLWFRDNRRRSSGLVAPR